MLPSLLHLCVLTKNSFQKKSGEFVSDHNVIEIYWGVNFQDTDRGRVMFGLKSTNQSFTQEVMVKRSLLRVSAASCGVSIDIETSVVCNRRIGDLVP